MDGLRTWIEIDKKTLRGNTEQFLRLIPKETRLMAVVKSNAYGHGLTLIAKLLVNFQKLWFGVDSIVEAMALRREDIKTPILVLGYTPPVHFREAARQNIILTISSFDSLRALTKEKNRPVFHLKIDTGMHRQGFLPEDIFKLIKLLKCFKLSPQGIYTHFAAAKDIAYPTHTFTQLKKFNSVVAKFKKEGFSAKGGSSARGGSASGGKNLIRHAAASGGTLLFSESHLDMVRVGMGLYGYFPSLEAKLHLQEKIKLEPVLTWKTLVAEIKEIPAGSYIGYDLTEKVAGKTKIAVLPVGYWHGYDRGLSSIGEVLVRGRRAKVLGRISMDMTVVNVTDIPKARVGDEAVLIGRDGKEKLRADELAMKIGTSQYEFLTRINPLIKRIVI